MKRSKQLLADADAIHAFRIAYGALKERNDRPAPSQPTRSDLTGLVEDMEHLRSAVNVAAGRAADAVDRADMVLATRDRAVNPIRSWRTAERPGATLTPRSIADFAEQTEATIRARAEAARRAEATLAAG